MTYDDPTELGGGGGRWFTGSPADGYGCDVCHEGGKPVELAVTGLPLDGYEPGKAYEVSLSWPANVDDLALIAEFTDEQRNSAGSLALPRPDAYMPADLCAQDEGGSPATDIYPALDGRMLIGVVDCGSHVARFQWTAPLVATSTLWFNTGFVVSNADAAPTGDGVTLASRALTPVSGATERTIAISGCGVTSPGTPRSGLLWVLVLGISCTVGCRRRVA